MFHCRVGLASLAGLLLAASAAPAATVNLAEPPDFANESSAATTIGSLGTLGIGSNTVTGSVSGNANLASLDYADSFVLTLPSGLAITSAQLDVTNYNAGAGDIPGIGSITDHGSFVKITGNGVYTLSAYATAGDFLVRTVTVSSLTVTPPNTLTYFDGSFDYTLTYNVEAATAAVPLPSSFALGAAVLPLCLGTLTVRRRQRQRSARLGVLAT